jgi:deferrochelatase/peroxidase EfeB
MQPLVTSKHLLGATELTLLAPIRAEFVPIPDPMSYARRLRTVLEALFLLRQTAIERDGRYDSAGPLESLRTLHALQWALLDRDTKLLLTVRFDGPWEPYIRGIVERAGPILDLIFCHCEGYEGHSCHAGYAEFSHWVRERQQSASFFYAGSPDLTVDDVRYLQTLQRKLGSGEPSDVALATHNVRVFTGGSPPSASAQADLASVLQALGRLFPAKDPASDDDDRSVFKRLERALTGGPPAPLTPREPRTPVPLRNPETLQGNVLTSYDNPTHGCLVLVRFDDRTSGANFLAALKSKLTIEGDTRREPKLNVALTYRGLSTLGLPAELLARFPKEFQEGMELRAGMLGDVGCNHPARWSLPSLNADGTERSERVSLDAVDALVTIQASPAAADGDHVWSPQHPLFSAVQSLRAPGVELLHVQALRRHSNFGHFGLADGLSQPVPEHLGANAPERDRVPLGEILLGYPNERGESLDLPLELVENGSFLAIRRMAQDTDALADFRKEAQRPEELVAKLLGREPTGEPLIGRLAATDNDFDYRDDPKGQACPFFSHVRRANPRETQVIERLVNGKVETTITRTPRIVRRGFSYGPPEPQSGPRGLLFMAYQSSLADQYEVVQRWVNGGNSTGILSSHADFIAGALSENSRPLSYLSRDGNVVRIEPPKKPLASLDWGLYAFAPSLRGVEELVRLAKDPASSSTTGAAAKLVDGLLALQREDPKRARFEWKRLLEEGDRRTALAVWQEVRKRGALATPYGVLVGSAEGVRTVLTDHATYSVRKYYRRMEETFGGHYLGMDPSPSPFEDDGYPQQVSEGQYAAASELPNAFLLGIDFTECFMMARGQTRILFRKAAKEPPSLSVMDVSGLARQVVTAIAAVWFGMPTDPAVVAVGTEASDGALPARCPVDFQRVSQFVFHPSPEPALQRTAVARGKVVEGVAREFTSGESNGKLCPHLRQQGYAHDLASAWTGSVNGFVVPTSGSFVSVMSQWIESRDLWRWQRWFLDPAGGDVRTRMRQGTMLRADVNDNPLATAMLRSMATVAVPDLLHRTALATTSLPSSNGPVTVEAGAHVVISLSSAAMERGDWTLLFGGDRKATGYPVHACPGQDMALGVLLGMLAGVFEQKNLRRKGKLVLSFDPETPAAS